MNKKIEKKGWEREKLIQNLITKPGSQTWPIVPVQASLKSRQQIETVTKYPQWIFKEREQTKTTLARKTPNLIHIHPNKSSSTLRKPEVHCSWKTTSKEPEPEETKSWNITKIGTNSKATAYSNATMMQKAKLQITYYIHIHPTIFKNHHLKSPYSVTTLSRILQVSENMNSQQRLELGTKMK